MANIDKNKRQVTIFQSSGADCIEPKTTDLKQFIDIVYSASGQGTLTDRVTSQLEDFLPISNLECGNSYLLNLTGVSTFNIPGATLAIEGANSNLMTTLFPTEFTITGKPTFHLTDNTVNKKPAYRTADGSMHVWFNNSTYVMSPNKASMAGAITNASCLPNSSYGDGRDPVSQSIQISGFTGSSASANGIFEEVGYFNDKPMFRNGSDCSYFYFFDGSRWVISNMAGSTSSDACFIRGTSDMFGALSSNGRCFTNQTGTSRDGKVDPRSLATESEQQLLATENKQSILITEEN